MKVLITGAAGNLGSFLTRHMLDTPHELRLLIHKTPMPFDLSGFANVEICQADLDKPETLPQACKDIDCIVHFAGVLFAPQPESFLHHTNVKYVQNLTTAALIAGVKKLILISFPHVEGESFPTQLAQGLSDGNPDSVHAQTRLAAEKHIFAACQGTNMVPIALRPGMIYGRDVLMVSAARWLLKHHLLAVWTKPTWIHLIALPDFLNCVVAAIEKDGISGIYNLGDDHPLTLQEFLDVAAEQWGYGKPWRLPEALIYLASGCCEAFATLFKTASPLTRDFIKIGMASYVSDISRMKAELLPELAYPALKNGLELL